MAAFLLSKELDKYTEKYTSSELPVLAALNRQTNLKRGDAVMLSGHLQGAFLQMLSHMIKPAQVLEIGTFTGYSAICLAQGLLSDGHLHTIEIDEELKDMAAHYIGQAGLSDKITQHIGVAADIITSLTGPFDIIFIDADKSNYGLYFDLVIDKVPIGGYIVADNVLYAGEVVLPKSERTKNGRAIHDFNKKVKADPRVEHVLVTVRDGLMVMRRVA